MTTVQPTLIIIETTGLADPIRLTDEVQAAGFRVDAIVTLVDAENAHTHLRSSRAARRQVSFADFLVLNKIDLVDEKQRLKVEKKLRRRNKRAFLIPAEFGVAPHEILFATSVATYRERLKAREEVKRMNADGDEGHLSADGITAFTYESQGRLDRERFEKFLKRLPSSVYRAKGIVRFDDGPFASLFNFTCGRFGFEWYRIPDGSQLSNQAVFIGERIEEKREELLQKLAVCEQ